VAQVAVDTKARGIYEEHYQFLLALALKKYDIPREDAAPLVHDVFVNFLASRRPITEARAYLVVGLCRACSDYWRRRRREIDKPYEYFDRSACDSIEDALVTRLTLQAALLQLRSKCRHTLRLYFVEGCTAREVATEVGTTRRYAEKLIMTCLGKLRLIYKDLSEMNDGASH
jgi:RNA polymerase sigma factor (sigma-70 family)